MNQVRSGCAVRAAIQDEKADDSAKVNAGWLRLQLLLNSIDYHRPEMKGPLPAGLEAAIKRASDPITPGEDMLGRLAADGLAFAAVLSIVKDVVGRSSGELTFEEGLLLVYLSARGPQPDHDDTACRVLINRGLAERFDPGLMRITVDGLALLADYVSPPAKTHVGALAAPAGDQFGGFKR